VCSYDTMLIVSSFYMSSTHYWYLGKDTGLKLEITQ
jgi:hypothetical protein